MGEKSLAFWHCSWCLIALLTHAAAVDGGQGDAGLVAREGVHGNGGGNATLAKYSEKQKRPRWEINLPPRRIFAYKAVPDRHNQDDGSEGDLVSGDGDETKRSDKPIN